MAATTFDTLKTNRKLKAAGFAEAQADALVEAMGDAFGDTVATKADVADLKADLAALETRLTKHVYSVVLAGVGLTVTLTTVLVKLL